MTTSEHHDKVCELFLAVCDLPREEQQRILEAQCADEVVRAEVLALLAQDGSRAAHEPRLDRRTGVPGDRGPSTLSDSGIITPLPPGEIPSIELGQADPSPGPASDGTTAWDIPGYRIIREIAHGGMGIVYEAVQTKLGRRVALKVLPISPGAPDRDAISRFRREATAAAKLHHTHIVPIYDFDRSTRAYYYAMELVEGATLTQLIRQFRSDKSVSATETQLTNLLQRALGANVAAAPRANPQADPPSSSTGSSASGRAYYRLVANWMADVAQALDYAHANQIIHRDIKPSNLMLSRDGRIMILDFGLAKGPGDLSVTQTGSLIGTLRYMSPEQAMAKRMTVDHRTDIYSLGATLYELLTLQAAFSGRDQKEVLGQIITREPTAPRKILPSVPRELETICLKCLEKDPNARYATGGALADDLRRYTQDMPIVAQRPGPIARLAKLGRRHPGATAAAALAVILALAVPAFFFHARRVEANRLAGQAIAFAKLEEWDAANVSMRRALSLDPNNAALLANLAWLNKELYNQGGPQALLIEAEELTRKAVAADGSNAGVWNQRGASLKMLDRYAEAEAAYSRAMECDPNYWPTWENRGVVRVLLGSFDSAKNDLERAVVLRPGEASAWRNLGALRLLLLDPAAEEAVLRAQSIKREEPATWMLLARVYLEVEELRSHEKALHAALAAENLAPTDERVLCLVATARLRNGQPREALEAVAKAQELGGDPARNALLRAIAYAQLGERPEAASALQTALQGWPTPLEREGTRISADKGNLWFETYSEWAALRKEAEEAIASMPN